MHSHVQARCRARDGGDAAIMPEISTGHAERVHRKHGAHVRETNSTQPGQEKQNKREGKQDTHNTEAANDKNRNETKQK